MSEPRIGRILVASMHQAIAELLPSRIEFYETWLTSTGLREGSIGVGPLSAVLSFLRLEAGSAYNQTTTRAGEYAGEWTVNTRKVSFRTCADAGAARKAAARRRHRMGTTEGGITACRLAAKRGHDRSAWQRRR